MIRIVAVLAVPAVSAGYCEDLAALRVGSIPPAERFAAPPVTPGFRAVREAAEAVSVGLVLEDGRVAWGDCVAGSPDPFPAPVDGSGAGDSAVFRAAEGQAAIRRAVAPLLEGRPLVGFRDLAAEVEGLTETVEVSRPLRQATQLPGEGVSRRALLTAPARVLQAARGEEGIPTERVHVERRLHPAIRYGVSQALLQAAALARGVTMAEVVAGEWGLDLPAEAIPVHARSGSDRNHGADGMIVRRVASLPHGQVDNVAAQVGEGGAELTRYLRWLKERIRHLGGDDYRPAIHLDLQGAVGQIHDNHMGRVLGQLYTWELAARPYQLRIEDPLILDSRDAQVEAMKTLHGYVRLRKMAVQLVAGAWADTPDGLGAFVAGGAADMIEVKMPNWGSIHNTVEAVLACRSAGVGALLGGDGAETDLTARVAVHLALATRPDLLVVGPGLGVAGAICLAQNEMARVLAQLDRRKC